MLSEETAAGYRSLVDSWPGMEERLRHELDDAPGAADRESFLAEWRHVRPLTPYAEAVAVLSPRARAAGTAWLQAVVDAVVDTAWLGCEGRPE